MFGNYGYSDRDKQILSLEELEQLVGGEKELWMAVYVGESQPKLEQLYKDLKSYFKYYYRYLSQGLHNLLPFQHDIASWWVRHKVSTVHHHLSDPPKKREQPYRREAQD